MGKRFTDTELYDQRWFRLLSPRLKCAWDFLNKDCDKIGLWHIDMDRLSFHVGEEVTLDELKSNFDVQVLSGDLLFLPNFVAFQCGDAGGKLSKKSQYHVDIARLLEAAGCPAPAWREEKKSSSEGAPTPPPRGEGTTTGSGRGRRRRSNKEEEGGAGETPPSPEASNLSKAARQEFLDRVKKGEEPAKVLSDIRNRVNTARSRRKRAKEPSAARDVVNSVIDSAVGKAIQ